MSLELFDELLCEITYVWYNNWEILSIMLEQHKVSLEPTLDPDLDGFRRVRSKNVF